MRAAVLFPSVVLAVCAVLLLANGLVYPINHDEQQYIAAAYLVSQGATPYVDFIYLQTPYYPLVVGASFTLFDVEQYFLSGRIANVVFSVLTVGLTGLVAWRLTRSPWLAGVVMLLFTTSSLMTFSFGVARNDILPCLFMMASLCLFLWQGEVGPLRHRLWLLSGLFASAAVASKVSYVFLPAALFLVVVWLDWHHRARAWTWLMAGFVVGALPVGWLALQDFEAFWYGNIQYHGTAPLEWYGSRDLDHRLEFSNQVRQMSRFFRDSPSTWLAVVGAVGLAGLLVVRRRLSAFLKAEVSQPVMVIPVALLLAIPLCILPRPTWIQYFVPMVPLLILLLALVWRGLQAEERRKAEWGVLAMGLVVSLWSGRGLLLQVPDLQDRSAWADAEIRAVETRLRQIQAERGASIRVATLSPMHVIDSDAGIFVELAPGPFFYRTAHLLPDDKIERLGGVGRAQLHDFLRLAQPETLLTGYEQDDRINLDADFVTFAQAEGFLPQPVPGTQATLWIRP